MKDKIGPLILSCEFELAQDIAIPADYKSVEDALLQLAYETDELTIYSFVCSLLIKSQSAQWHYLASLLLSQPLCHIDGAYRAAYYHAKMASRLSPFDSTLKEYLLFFWEIPDKLLTDTEAARIAAEILEAVPNSEIAKTVIKSIRT